MTHPSPRTGTTVIVARHGNTFSEGQTPTRVGGRTDLPLVETGENQALRLGHHFKALKIVPAAVYTSTLRRTIDTARLICTALSCGCLRDPLPFLNEIDYGPDENKTDDAVRARLGDDALKRWDDFGEMPADWSPRPEEIILNWRDFLNRCLEDYAGKTVLVVASNGVARFALSQATNGDTVPLKLATGAYGILRYSDEKGGWSVTDWNIRPS